MTCLIKCGLAPDVVFSCNEEKEIVSRASKLRKFFQKENGCLLQLVWVGSQVFIKNGDFVVAEFDYSEK
jgi:hypothetical protein